MFRHFLPAIVISLALAIILGSLLVGIAIH